jgi:hypothetical protein
MKVPLNTCCIDDDVVVMMPRRREKKMLIIRMITYEIKKRERKRIAEGKEDDVLSLVFLVHLCNGNR